MKILLTNDDGIYAPGMWALYEQLSTRHDVSVIAPDRERSAVSHGITLHSPLRANRVTVNGGFQGHAVDGTPADCVKLGLLEILDHRPDLVLSGINPGANVGVNLNYSGTVAAAKEAAMSGVMAIAISADSLGSDDYEDAARFAVRLAEKVFENKLPFGTFLNVNLPGVPFNRAAGIRISRQGFATFADRMEKRLDPRNRPYYWQGIDRQRFNGNPDVDGTALQNNYISITPVQCDMTDYRCLDSLRNWGWETVVDSGRRPGPVHPGGRRRRNNKDDAMS